MVSALPFYIFFLKQLPLKFLSILYFPKKFLYILIFFTIKVPTFLWWTAFKPETVVKLHLVFICDYSKLFNHGK